MTAASAPPENAPLAASGEAVVISECQINARESFRLEICPVRGRDVVRISRWKSSPTGPRRAGAPFEFGAHRIAGVSKLFSDLETFLADRRD